MFCNFNSYVPRPPHLQVMQALRERYIFALPVSYRKQHLPER
jgi:hypothetical protein